MIKMEAILRPVQVCGWSTAPHSSVSARACSLCMVASLEEVVRRLEGTGVYLRR